MWRKLFWTVAVVAAFAALGVMAQSPTDECAADYYGQLFALIEDAAPFAEIAELAIAAELACAPEELTDDGALYRIAVSREINFRAGPGTQYEKVGLAQPGEIYAVIGEHAGSPYNWLEVRLEDQTAYVAKELTLRQPAETLEPGQYHAIPEIDCNLRFLKDDHSIKTIAFAITGDNATAIEVALFRPEQSYPLPTHDRITEPRESDPDSYVVYQIYSQWFSDGVYRIEVSNGEKTYAVGLDVQGAFVHLIRLICD